MVQRRFFWDVFQLCQSLVCHLSLCILLPQDNTLHPVLFSLAEIQDLKVNALTASGKPADLREHCNSVCQGGLP